MQAQAIMLLAGNGPPVTSTAPPPAAPVQASVLPMSNVLDRFVVSKPYCATPLRSSPVPISPIPISVSHNAARMNKDLTAMKPTGILASTSNRSVPSKGVNSIRSIPATPFLSSGTLLISHKILGTKSCGILFIRGVTCAQYLFALCLMFHADTVPQFRRKSLARFLEKRKER